MGKLAKEKCKQLSLISIYRRCEIKIPTCLDFPFLLNMRIAIIELALLSASISSLFRNLTLLEKIREEATTIVLRHSKQNFLSLSFHNGSSFKNGI